MAAAAKRQKKTLSKEVTKKESNRARNQTGVNLLGFTCWRELKEVKGFKTDHEQVFSD